LSEKEFLPFDVDVQRTGAYQYSAGTSYSAALANARLSDLTQEAMSWKGLRVLDVGCGDGVYSMELYRRGAPSELVGIDLSPAAIASASSKVSSENMHFILNSGTHLPFPDNSFDAVHLRGVLHHMENPQLAIKEAFRVARTVFIIEPNGWNAGLKCIEKLSKYHRDHHERSFTSRRIDHWIKLANGVTSYRKWAGFVPMFCPRPMARAMKLIEPILEFLPVVRQATCAVYVAVGVREGSN
jgi:SAM-dependent methyltransferase